MFSPFLTLPLDHVLFLLVLGAFDTKGCSHLCPGPVDAALVDSGGHLSPDFGVGVFVCTHFQLFCSSICQTLLDGVCFGVRPRLASAGFVARLQNKTRAPWEGCALEPVACAKLLLRGDVLSSLLPETSDLQVLVGGVFSFDFRETSPLHLARSSSEEGGEAGGEVWLCCWGLPFSLSPSS